MVFSMGYGMGFGMGLSLEEFRLLQVKSKNREIEKNRVLSCKYRDKIVFLQKTWNDPMVILSTLYNGDWLESMLIFFFPNTAFPEIKAERSKIDKIQGFQNQPAFQMCSE